MIKAMVKKISGRRLSPCLLWATAISVLGSAGFGLVFGTWDTFWPVSIGSQFVGLRMLAAGLIAIGGFVAVVRLRRSILSWPPGSWAERLGWVSPRPSWAIMLACAGAVASVYIDLTITLYAYRFRLVLTVVFAGLGLLGLALLVVTACAVALLWSDISAAAKSLSAVGAVLALVVQFWYQQAYLPENTEVGINYGVTVGAVTPDGNYSLIPVTLTMKNESSVTALTLQSMVVVTALHYAAKPSSADDPATSSTRTVLQPIENASYVFPGSPYTKSFVVSAPKQDQALQIGIQVDYARVPRLVLGGQLNGGYALEKYPPLKHCQGGHVTAYGWRIRESALRAFTTGDLVLYSYWCQSPTRLDIDQNIAVGTAVEPSATESELQNHFGTRHSTRLETILIPRSSR